MPDPFEVLRTPVAPIDPDPTFAARLRSRLERAMSLPKGVTVSNVDLTTQPEALEDVPTIRHGDVSYVSLWVPDAERAQRFFSAVLGWPSQGHRKAIGRAVGHGFAGGVPHNTLFLCFAVDDVDATIERVTAAGGQADAPTLEPWGRSAMCSDRDGLPFAVYQLATIDPGARPAFNGERHGDVSYLTMEVTDSGRARAFYGAVLGWKFVPGRIDDGWGPVDVAPMVGMSGGHPVATVVPMYRVDDIRAAVRRVREAGGSATDPEQQPYGLSSVCRDDQETRFYLGES